MILLVHIFMNVNKLCLNQSRGGRRGLLVLNSPYEPRGRKRTLKNRAMELFENRGGRPGLSATSSLYGLCGRKATFEEKERKKKAVI